MVIIFQLRTSNVFLVSALGATPNQSTQNIGVRTHPLALLLLIAMLRFILYEEWVFHILNSTCFRPSCETLCKIFMLILFVGSQTDEKANRQSNLFDDARGKGLLISDTSGAPYMIPNTSFEAAMMDLTNPETRKWIKGLMSKMAKTGVRGWMADFGESLPFDACLHSGNLNCFLYTHT